VHNGELPLYITGIYIFSSPGTTWKVNERPWGLTITITPQRKKITYGLCPIQKVLDRFDVVVSVFIET
jgi:hypothetical protein